MCIFRPSEGHYGVFEVSCFCRFQDVWAMPVWLEEAHMQSLGWEAVLRQGMGICISAFCLAIRCQITPPRMILAIVTLCYEGGLLVLTSEIEKMMNPTNMW